MWPGAVNGMTRRVEDTWWRYRLTLAPVLLRVVAFLVDGLIVVAAVGSYFWFVEGFGAVVGSYFDKDLKASLPPGVFSAGVTKILGLSFLAGLIYDVFGEGSPWMGTIGKRLVGIRVVDEYGERITFTTAIIRSLMKIVSVAAFGAGCISALWSPSSQTWHDRATGTFVAGG